MLKLSCSCQDHAPWALATKPLKPTALDSKLSCFVPDKTLDATFPIPPSLSLTIVLDEYRIFLTALFLVIRMFVPPLFLAFADDLSILRIGPKLLPVIISSAPALALRLAADDLLGAVNGT